MTGPDRSISRDNDRRWGFSRLTRRAEFTRVARGMRANASSIGLQAAQRPETSGLSEPRIGLTITRKTGGAVERNRMRRRLRAALKATEGLDQRHDHDYVIVARREALMAPFAGLCADLKLAFERVHRAARRHSRRRSAPADRAIPPDGSPPL